MFAEPLKQRIALILGIPVTQEEFYGRATDPSWDYGRALASGSSLDHAFAELYTPVCRTAATLLQRAAAMGVSIYRSAQLLDLEQASHTHDVLILVAHWRGSAVHEHDLREGVESCLSSPASGSPLDLLAEELRQILARSGHPTRPSELRAFIARAMNALIRSKRLTPFFPSALGKEGGVEAHPLIIDTLSRDLLDSCLSEHVYPGNQLELSDGLHPIADVSDAIAADFQGVIDLSCCTASVLGTYLQFERGDLIDLIMGDHFVVPAPQLALIDATLELVAEPPSLGYAAARRALSRGLADWRKR